MLLQKKKKTSMKILLQHKKPILPVSYIVLVGDRLFYLNVCVYKGCVIKSVLENTRLFGLRN